MTGVASLGNGLHEPRFASLPLSQTRELSLALNSVLVLLSELSGTIL